MAKTENPIQQATKRTRALVRATLGSGAGTTVKSPTAAASSVTYPAGADHEALKAAALAAGATSVLGGEYGMTINWKV